MAVTGIHPPTHPPKIARELKQRIAELLTRYTFDEVIEEIAKAKPKLDIYICAAGQKPVCGD